jgi:hypothetical protein
MASRLMSKIGAGLALDTTPAGSFGKRHADERRPYICLRRYASSVFSTLSLREAEPSEACVM